MNCTEFSGALDESKPYTKLRFAALWLNSTQHFSGHAFGAYSCEAKDGGTCLYAGSLWLNSIQELSGAVAFAHVHCEVGVLSVCCCCTGIHFFIGLEELARAVGYFGGAAEPAFPGSLEDHETDEELEGESSDDQVLTRMAAVERVQVSLRGRSKPISTRLLSGEVVSRWGSARARSVAPTRRCGKAETLVLAST